MGILGVGSIGRTLATALDEKRVDADANPRTSQLAAFSAFATLANLTRALRVGT